MADTLTVTGVIGPGLTLTAQVFHGVTSFRVDTVNNLLFVTANETNGVEQSISITAATVFTVTKSGSDYTVAIS